MGLGTGLAFTRAFTLGLAGLATGLTLLITAFGGAFLLVVARKGCAATFLAFFAIAFFFPSEDFFCTGAAFTEVFWDTALTVNRWRGEALADVRLPVF